MGLGKTVQSIALMLAHPQKEKGKPKTTLVVCPLALLHQWQEEVDSKADDLSVCVCKFHCLSSPCCANSADIKLRGADHGPKRKDIAPKLSKYRVVVTTYDGQFDCARAVEQRTDFSDLRPNSCLVRVG